MEVEVKQTFSIGKKYKTMSGTIPLPNTNNKGLMMGIKHTFKQQGKAFEFVTFENV